MHPLQAPKQAVQDSLEQRLRAKCCRVAHWQAPAHEAEAELSLQLARVKQLPQLLSQQRKEAERCQEEMEEMKQECRELMARRHKVCMHAYVCVCVCVRVHVCTCVCTCVCDSGRGLL